MKKLILITILCAITAKSLAYTTKIQGKTIRENYLLQCWDANEQTVLPTDYCLEVGERLGFVRVE